MTVPSQVLKSVGLSNGENLDYNYNFKIYKASEIVALPLDENGIEQPVLQLNQYSVSGIGENNGTVTLTNPLPSGWKLILYAQYSNAQESSFSNEGDFDAKRHEAVYDKIHSILMQHQEELDRCVKVLISSDISPDELVSSISQAAANAAASADKAEAAYDSLDDRYLGVKSADPTTDNDGQALTTGARYYNDAIDGFKYWNGTSWQLDTTPATPDAANTQFTPANNAFSAANVKTALDLLYAALEAEIDTGDIADEAITTAKLSPALAASITRAANIAQALTSTPQGISNTETELNNLSVNLTPESTSSKVKIDISLAVLSDGTDGAKVFAKLIRDIGGTETTLVSKIAIQSDVANGGIALTAPFSYIDTPNTDSEVTYKLAAATTDAACTANFQYDNSTSTIIAEEKYIGS